MSRSFVERRSAQASGLAVTLATLLLLLGAPRGSLAETEAASLDPMARLEQQLLELKRQIAEMERRNP